MRRRQIMAEKTAELEKARKPAVVVLPPVVKKRRGRQARKPIAEAVTQ